MSLILALAPALRWESLLIVETTPCRQAAAELSSIFKSLENRYNKGLLSESEKVRYAEMCAEKEKARRLGMGKSGKEGDCVIC